MINSIHNKLAKKPYQICQLAALLILLQVESSRTKWTLVYLVVSQCVGQQLTYNLVICSFPKLNIFLSLNNNTSDLIEEKHKEHMIKLSRITFHPL